MNFMQRNGGIDMCRAMELKEKRDINRGMSREDAIAISGITGEV